MKRVLGDKLGKLLGDYKKKKERPLISPGEIIGIDEIKGMIKESEMKIKGMEDDKTEWLEQKGKKEYEKTLKSEKEYLEKLKAIVEK